MYVLSGLSRNVWKPWKCDRWPNRWMKQIDGWAHSYSRPNFNGGDNYLTYQRISFSYLLGAELWGHPPNMKPTSYNFAKAKSAAYALANWVINGSGNGLSPVRHQAITWTNADILSIRPLGTNFTEIRITIHNFSFMKMHMKMLFVKWWPFCPGEMS